MARVSAFLPGIEEISGSRKKPLVFGFLVVALLVLSLLMARPAHAADFFVVDRSDDPNLATTPTADDCTSAANDCSLRGAITRSNSSTADDSIDFDIPASACNATTGVCTITPTTQLPSITDAVTIDGYQQTGASPNTLTTNFNNAVLKVEINGAVASGGVTLTPGLSVIGTGASGTVIRGLVINRFSLHGVVIDAGAVATVEGNFIGTDPTGTQDLGNGFDGVLVTSSNNRIGGAANAAQNVISGNGRDGVSVAGQGATDNIIINNHIGTDADAGEDLGNTGDGVFVASSDTIVGGNDQNTGNGAGQDDGTALGEGNIISGNDAHGVLVENSSAEGTKVLGNHIGVDRNGNRDLGNGLDGVRVSNAPQVGIGGATDGLGNTISKNGQHGVEIVGTSSTFVKVQGNRIGTDYIARNDLGNAESGVSVETSGNFIGTDANGFNDASEGNVISGNDNHGVQIVGASATGNRILRNSIFGNGNPGGLGIDLNNDGVTLNDNRARDRDTGPNLLQNFPVLSSASTTQIKGALKSRPRRTFTIQFFSNPAPNFPTLFGEGQTFLGETTVRTNRKGKASFTFTTAVSAGEFVTATATDSGGNTSEFSAAREVQ